LIDSYSSKSLFRILSKINGKKAKEIFVNKSLLCECFSRRV